MLENKFQAGLIKKLYERFPDCLVLKNDPDYIQGIPDLLLLYGNHWAALEAKRDDNATFRPNQVHYLETMNRMSIARVVYPDNVEEVLDDIQRAFES